MPRPRIMVRLTARSQAGALIEAAAIRAEIAARATVDETVVDSLGGTMLTIDHFLTDRSDAEAVVDAIRNRFDEVVAGRIAGDALEVRIHDCPHGTGEELYPCNSKRAQRRRWNPRLERARAEEFRALPGNGGGRG